MGSCLNFSRREQLFHQNHESDSKHKPSPNLMFAQEHQTDFLVMLSDKSIAHIDQHRLPAERFQKNVEPRFAPYKRVFCKILRYHFYAHQNSLQKKLKTILQTEGLVLVSLGRKSVSSKLKQGESLMKHFAKASFFAVAMLVSSVQAENPVVDWANDTTDMGFYYAEQMARLAVMDWAGGMVQKNVPTHVIENMIGQLVDKLPLVEQYNLRHRGARVVWGAAAIATLRMLLKQTKMDVRLRKDTPSVKRLLDWLMDFRTRRADDV